MIFTKLWIRPCERLLAWRRSLHPVRSCQFSSCSYVSNKEKKPLAATDCTISDADSHSVDEIHEVSENTSRERQMKYEKWLALSEGQLRQKEYRKTTIQELAKKLYARFSNVKEDSNIESKAQSNDLSIADLVDLIAARRRAKPSEDEDKVSGDQDANYHDAVKEETIVESLDDLEYFPEFLREIHESGETIPTELELYVRDLISYDYIDEHAYNASLRTSTMRCEFSVPIRFLYYT